MAREEIDLKSVKKLNNSGKPKKKSTVNKKFRGPQPAKGKSSIAGKSAGKSGKTSKMTTQGATKKLAVSRIEKDKKNSKKSDTKQITENTVKKTLVGKKTQVPEEWLYMNADTEDIQVVKRVCEDFGYDVEFWPELGILEVNVDEKTSMDFELFDSYEVDEATTEYVNNNKIQLTMIVSARAERYGKLIEILENIAEKTDGFFCLDDGKFEEVK